MYCTIHNGTKAPLSVLHCEVRDSTAAIIRFTINQEAYDNYSKQDHDRGLCP